MLEALNVPHQEVKDRCSFGFTLGQLPMLILLSHFLRGNRSCVQRDECQNRHSKAKLSLLRHELDHLTMILHRELISQCAYEYHPISQKPDLTKENGRYFWIQRTPKHTNQLKNLRPLKKVLNAGLCYLLQCQRYMPS